jgi:preprotein translocase subunit SecE
MAVTTRRRSETGGEEFPVIRFLREVFDELRKVVWPTPGELYRYTMVVVATVIVISLFIGGVDYAVGQLVKQYVYSGLKPGG